MIISRYRNKTSVDSLVNELEKRGFSCYNFCDTPADPYNPDAPPEEQQKFYENNDNFFNNSHARMIFEKDLAGLKNAERVILLLPAGTSSHIELGMAYGLGKKVILIGEPEKNESLYFIFSERYKSIDNFLQTLVV